MLSLISLATFVGFACAAGGAHVIVTIGQRTDVPPRWPKGSGGRRERRLSNAWMAPLVQRVSPRMI